MNMAYIFKISAEWARKTCTATSQKSENGWILEKSAQSMQKQHQILLGIGVLWFEIS